MSPATATGKKKVGFENVKGFFRLELIASFSSSLLFQTQRKVSVPESLSLPSTTTYYQGL